MATRVSPRSNASSASTSSSSSRRAFRNPSFGKERDGFDVDRWGSDGRNNDFFAGNQHQHLHQQHHRGQWGQQHLHQQHSQDQWGQKSYGTERAWGNTGIQIRERNQESELSWRTQKQALHSFQDGGRSKGIQQPNVTYEQSYPPVQAVRGQWNQATSRGQRYHVEEGRSTSSHTQQVRWEKPKQDQNAQGQINSNRRSSSFYHNQGNRGAHTQQVRWEKPKQDQNVQGQINPNRPSPSSYHNQGNKGAFTSQANKGAFTSQLYGNKKDPFKLIQDSRGFLASSRQEHEYASGTSSNRSRAGEAGVQNAYAAIRDWNYGAPERMDNLPLLTTVGEPGARTSQAVPASSSVTARVWGGSGAFTRRWADECEDDQWNDSMLENEVRTTSHRVDCVSSDTVESGRPNMSMYNHKGFVRSVSDKTSWQQNWEETTIEARTDSSARQVRPGNASRSSIAREQKVAIEEQRPGTGGQSQKVSGHNQRLHYPRGVDIGKGSTTRPEIQSSSTQVYPEGLDDVALPFIMGTCEDMCPSQEREQRERLRDLAVFERLNGNPGKTSRDLAVKKFCRTFSGVKLLSSDVRPLRVLWSTLQYLLNLLDDSEFPFDVVHNFLFDRTRAIRQELGMQRIVNSQAINMYEEIVRFHILSEHELSQRGSGRNVSDSHLNLQQLSKALLSLFDVYRLNHHEKLANEAEFRAYYVLLNLDSIHHFQADSLCLWFRQCPAALLNTWEVKFARAVLRCYCSGNYRRFFLLAQEATFLQSCLMELHFNEVRLSCLAAMNQGGYKLHPIPLADIAKQLLMKEGDLEELCNLCGLSTGMDTLRTRCLLVKQSQFSSPKEIPPYRCACIVGKQPTSYYEEATGTNCTPKRLS